MSFRSDGWSRELQDKTLPFVRSIYDVLGHEPGYCDLGVNFGDLAVEVYFHGPFPEALNPVIDRARAAGVAVVQIPTDYGELELRHATNTVGAALRAAGIDWNHIGPTSKFSGLQVGGPEVSVEPSAQHRAYEIAAELIGDIPVTFVPDEGPIIMGPAIVREAPPT